MRILYFELHVISSYLSHLGFHYLLTGYEAHREEKEGLPDPREAYYKFAVVRHPLERLASAFFQKVSAIRPHDNKHAEEDGPLLEGSYIIKDIKVMFACGKYSNTLQSYIKYQQCAK